MILNSFILNGNPKSDQSLKEVQALLLGEIEKMKKGEFSEDLMKSAIRNLKKDQLSQFEYNWLRGYIMADSYIMEDEWENYVNFFDQLENISKEEDLAPPTSHLL